jgi:ATP-dependent Clp protease protease subunit
MSGKQYSLLNSRIMVHQPIGGAQGQQTDIEIQANEILLHKTNLNGYLAYHTGQPYETFVQYTDQDFFMSAKEAKEYCLIDAVISNPLKALQPLPEPIPAWVNLPSHCSLNTLFGHPNTYT